MRSGIIIFSSSTLNGGEKPLGRAGRVDNGDSFTHPLLLPAPYNNYSSKIAAMSFTEALFVTLLVNHRLYKVQTWLRRHWRGMLITGVLKRTRKDRVGMLKKNKVKCIWLKDLGSYFFGGDVFINEAYRIGPLLNRLFYCPLVLWVMVRDTDEEGMITFWGK